MKKILILMTAVLLVAGCKKKDVLVPVRVHVDDFSISQEDFPSRDSGPIGDYTGVKAITLAFYKTDGSEQFKVTQFRSD